jgi:hypothetical protein
VCVIQFDISYHSIRYIREATDTLWPGYLVHEAVEWFDIDGAEGKGVWVFMPKHQSKKNVYVDTADEVRV